QAFPAAVADLAQPVTLLRLEVAGGSDDGGRFQRPRQRAAVERGDAFLLQALAEPRRLPASFVREIDPDGSREPVLGGELCGPVAHEIEARGVHRGLILPRPPVTRQPATGAPCGRPSRRTAAGKQCELAPLPMAVHVLEACL